MDRWEIDPERSVLSIDGRSSLHPIVFSTHGLEGFVEGSFEDGRLVGPVAGALGLDLARLKSGNVLQDNELRRRIDARRHPRLTAHLETLAAGEAGRYRASGQITFRGVTRAALGELTIEVDAGTLVLSGASGFDIRDFGMEPPRLLGLRVHPEVTVGIHAVALA